MIAAYSTRIEIKDYSKVGLVKRIREKEAAGWECIQPISKRCKEAVIANCVDSGLKYKRTYVSRFEHYVVMKKTE
ncbi:MULTISPECIES: hypothetical protein [Bacillus]|uniref:hypothetical protein n=1 Tax=Bacillus TaxID=1386 RepID=UPI0009532B00|nr:hypothetical protein [Bacillus licheniformis]MCU9959262.1 hypothetical protein [Bacillus licheniformis]MED1028817.1 hypothetical protein [Bacillus licheniformis]MED1101766.1 hypothetical protein [Bacillus licheniformis]OLQ50008.1 hypothetical protein BHT96_07625 [Bacillus licheniformis]PAE73829.1 hypothetical protein CHH84_02165 [Bacillus licheniformis]